ncbi:MAG: flagellar biosynthetic protein FliO [Woeseia sp.]|nr:flagellar biosynthetic protein FliO [Woeseia sp.]MBT8096500.1 flagellar biosynthetic protein FliO [Woeseia sp.]NNE61848.1 flagellar biosynthetic protein FliO [Woeseia sp.]NNL53739.1 flagellar biosynthetic protein FliO [Woeseia sp.]
MTRLMVLLVMWLLPVAGVAAAEAGAAPVGPGDLLNVGTGLVLVVGAILLCGWLYTRTQSLRGGSSGMIRIIASQPLGTKERVVLLQVANQQLLVGMTSSQVQTLHVFEKPLEVDETPTGGFAERLRAAVKGQSQ